MDVLTPQQRRRCMQANKSRGTRPERAMGRMLWNAGVRYRKNTRTLPGHPDFSIKKFKMVIFVDGEFWHGRNWEQMQNRFSHNKDYWITKIERNKVRDAYINALYAKFGWRVFRFWESDVIRRAGWCLSQVLDYIASYRRGYISLYVPEDYLAAEPDERMNYGMTSDAEK